MAPRFLSKLFSSPQEELAVLADGEIENNHEEFAHNRAIASSRHVRNLLRAKPQATGTG